MNKAELVDVIAAKTNVTKKDADLILSAMTQTIVEVVSGGDTV
ncbi:DNA-binding protein, partial [Chroococcidiopsis cubana CCALA 043]